MATVREIIADVHGDDWEKWLHVEHVFGVETVIIPNVARRQTLEPSAIDEANARILSDEWANEPAVTWVSHVFCESLGLHLDMEAPENLFDTLDFLMDYPILDEQVWSEVEDEWIGEYVEHYMFDDVIRYLDDEELHDTTLIYEAWYRYQSEGYDYHLEYDHLVYDVEALAELVQDMATN